MTTITDDLKLVLPVRGDKEGLAVHAYHTPISRAVFEANFRLLASTRAAMLSQGAVYMMDSGPRIAALTLREQGRRLAEADGVRDDDGEGGAKALLGEIARLTTILAPGDRGWDMVPVEEAIKRGVMDDEEWGEVLSSIVFFTCIYALAKKADRQRVASTTASTLGSSITSLSAMAFVDSLPTSTSSAPTVTKAESSVPS